LKKIISFSLWGDLPLYCVGAIKNSILAKEIYPDWICRFYISTCVPKKYTDILKQSDNCEIIFKDKPDLFWEGTFWRFEPASDTDVSVMISRDTDSRLNYREKAAVDEWLTSANSFHIMRDHQYHTSTIMAGMWGVKNPKLINMKKYIKEWKRYGGYGSDQHFLSNIIYPIVSNDCIIHDDKKGKKFPIKCQNQSYVGNHFNWDEKVLKDDTGLGDSVSRVTKKLGIKECSPCAARKQKLNRMFPYK